MSLKLSLIGLFLRLASRDVKRRANYGRRSSMTDENCSRRQGANPADARVAPEESTFGEASCFPRESSNTSSACSEKYIPRDDNDVIRHRSTRSSREMIRGMQREYMLKIRERTRRGY